MVLKWLLSAIGIGRSREQEQADFLRSAGIEYENMGNYEMAFQMFHILAEKGHVDCQGKVGSMLAAGIGAPKDERQAAKWLRKASEQGDSTAQWNLGVLYKLGKGVPQDNDEALRWIEKAAAGGDRDAQNALGAARARSGNFGDSVEQFRRAAESGNPVAQHNLGIAYLMGEGVPVDRQQALKWFYKAAEQGYSESWYNLGIHYFEGYIGYHRDPAYAYMWFTLAEEAGVEDAIIYKRDIEKMIPKKEITRARKLAKEWKSKHPPR